MTTAKRPCRSRRAVSTKRKRRARTLIRIKRAYDKPDPGDGSRILIDRIWPRGVAKSKLKVDAWPRRLAPSAALRQWYQHDPARFPEFRRRYLAEIKAQGENLAALRAALRGRTVTLITATRDITHSHAKVLSEALGGSQLGR